MVAAVSFWTWAAVNGIVFITEEESAQIAPDLSGTPENTTTGMERSQATDRVVPPDPEVGLR
jgi:hypothetical protein